MYCGGCGHTLRDGARFCDRCGLQTQVFETHDPTVPSTFVDGRYRVVQQIGDGLRKRVYWARDTVLDRDVALAILRSEGLEPNERTRAEREVRMVARLGGHPNIVTLYDVEDLDDGTGLVFEYVPGRSLRDLLDSTGPRGLPVRDTLRIAEQVAHALDAVHRERILFRDLKAGNVLLAGDGTAKLADFGYALAIGQSRLSDPGAVVGSLAYLAPERIANRHADQRSDLYALGILCYEMLTGRPPFTGDDVQEVGAQHLHATPSPLTDARPGLPPDLVDLVDRLLAKEVGDRPEHAATVAAELGRIRASI